MINPNMQMLNVPGLTNVLVLLATLQFKCNSKSRAFIFYA